MTTPSRRRFRSVLASFGARLRTQETSEVLETIVQDDFNKSQVWSALTASLSRVLASVVALAVAAVLLLAPSMAFSASPPPALAPASATAQRGSRSFQEPQVEVLPSTFSCGEARSTGKGNREEIKDYMDHSFEEADLEELAKEVEKEEMKDTSAFQTARNGGSLEVQIAVATEKIRNMILHMRQFKRDYKCRLKLVSLVCARRRMLDKLSVSNLESYMKIRTQKKLNFRRWLARPYDEVKAWEKNNEVGTYARLTFSGVVIATRATASKAEALRLRRRVEDLAQRAVRSGCPMDGPLEGFRTAVNCAADLDLGLNFRLVLDLRRYVGRKIQSPVLGSIEDVLRLRERLMEAQKGEKAWPALRREWVAWMTCPRRRRWKSCSRSHREAEELIEKAEAEWNVTKAKKLRDARQALRLARAARDAEDALLAEQRVKPLKRKGNTSVVRDVLLTPSDLKWIKGNTLVRLASVMHGSALDEICGEGAAGQVCMDITGLDIDTLRFLRDCYDVYGFNKALQHMIQNLVTYNQQIGVLTIPPPILSRVYQTLSKLGWQLWTSAQPVKQIITMLIVSYCISTPLVVSAIIKQYAWAMLVTFIPVFSIIALNIVCAQLEMPFGSDANDLPLQHFQERHQWGKEEMNRGLLLLIHEMTDHIVLTRDNAVEADEDVGDDTAAVPRESRVLKVKEVDPKEKLKEEPRGQAVKEKALSTLDAQSTRRNADLLNHQLTEIAQNTHALEANTKALRSLASLFDSVDVSSEAQATPDNGRQLLRDLRNLLTRVQVDDPGPVVNAQSAFCARCACETSPG
eukprot:g1455.t1